MTVSGECKFCHQVKMVDIPDDLPEDAQALEAERQASMECKCKEGSDWRASMYVLEKCQENIELIFRDSYPDVADLLQEAKELVYYGTFKKLTISTPGSAAAMMYMKGGSIVVKLTQKSETEMSADW